MRKLMGIALLGAVLMVSPGFSRADTPRRPSGAEITAVVYGTYHHQYSVTATECRDGYWRFEGTGTYGGGSVESIVGYGTFTWPIAIHWVASYTDSTYQWTFDGTFDPMTGVIAGAGSDSIGQTFATVDGTLQHTFGEYRNHGAVVTTAGGGAGAAHDFLGMPVWARR